MIEMMISFLLTANVCIVTTDTKPIECKHYLLEIGSRNVCEAKKAALMQNVLWTQAEDYGWPKGTQFSVEFDCSPWAQRLGA